MKKLKKAFCMILSVLFAVMILPVFASAESGTPLQFNSDGKFRIMAFADIQDDEDVEETTLALMKEALELYRPDLVVFLGDNTIASGYENQYAAIKAITEPCVSANIPFAVVFGNHDQEHDVEKEELLAVYREFGCLTYDAAPELFGCGTCNLPILSSDGARTAFNIWLTDSGSSDHSSENAGYDYVHEDQINWYKDTAAALKAANGGEVVPSINFQHIVVPEIYDALGCPTLPLAVGNTMTYNGKTYIPIPKLSMYSGLVLETPCPPYTTQGQFDAWVETGDVLASFFGHDHDNNYSVNYRNIDLVNVPTVGCNSYSNDLTRGAGLITLDENNPTEYSYESVHIYDIATMDGSAIPTVSGGESKAYYKLVKFFYEFLETLQSVFSMFSFSK